LHISDLTGPADGHPVTTFQSPHTTQIPKRKSEITKNVKINKNSMTF
jgi:hypothetical protein